MQPNGSSSVRCEYHAFSAATPRLASSKHQNTPWKLYNHLIAGIPEDVVVRDYCLGTHWSYVFTL